MSYSDLFLSTSPLITISGEEKVQMFGVPFDSTSSYRVGSRDGPNALRQAYWNIEIYDQILKVNAENVPVKDLGNMNLTVDSNYMLNAVAKVTGEIKQGSKVPAIIGGEHLLTLSSAAQFEGSSLLVFDAHLDYRDELYGLRISHGTFLRRLLEKVKFKKVVHVGSHAISEMEVRDGGRNMDIISSFDINQSFDNYRMALKDMGDDIYVSIDLDVVDPAYAPGVGNPEPGGLTTMQILNLLYLLKDKKLVGFDIVELDPYFDTGITAPLAAKLFSILTIMASGKR
ncbi:MAG: agmatinase [Nitrososphaerota archaeon]|jgi:agmatinase|nr:agmatinase [Nitrososphaerota archaeon]MDG7038557.1 agmatinase [Nitrososphaerota archaeon]MDG7040586.1 agmatinase [Nitrososphaerota archaeon]